PAGRLTIRAELLPGVASVARDIEPTARAAGDQLPRLAPRLPQAGEHDSRVVRVDRHVRGARVRVREQHPVPGLAAVLGAVDAAFGAWSEGVPEHRGERDVGVPRVDGHCPDLADLVPDVLPGLAGVGAPVDAVAGRDVAADVGLAAADVDHVRV